MQFHTTGIVLAALTVVSAASAQTTQAVEWKVSEGGNGHWYKSVATNGRTWGRLGSDAQAIGAHLVTIGSQMENQFLTNLIAGYAFIGGIGDGRCNGPWNWVDGSAFNYTAWDATQPDCVGENVIVLYPSGRWHDYSENAPISFALLEWDADCNGDGIVDYGQILSGQLDDDNANGVPDVCEPNVTGVIPVSGPSSGGSAIIIKGTNFPENPMVLIGGVPATDVVRVSATRITATTPAGLPGMTTVTVGNWVQPNAFYYRPECGSDLDQDGEVTAADIAIVLLDFGPCYQAPPAAPAPEVPPLLDAQALPDAPRQR